MPILEIHCGVLDVSINAIIPVLEDLDRPTDADVITDLSYDFISTMYVPTEVMQNLFHYRITPQNNLGQYYENNEVVYYTRSLKDDFSIAPVRFNPMCVVVTGSTDKFDNSCDNLVDGKNSSACDQHCNSVDYNIVPYVLMRYMSLAVLNNADGWRMFTNYGDASWNINDDIVPKLFSDAQTFCFDESNGVIGNAFKTEHDLTTIDSSNIVATNTNVFGSKTMADLVYRTMLAEDNTRFHIEDPTLVFNPMPFASGDCLSFLFTVGMGNITNIGDMATSVTPNNVVIKVRIQCAGPGLNGTAPVYSDVLHYSMSNTTAEGVVANIRDVIAPGQFYNHTDYYTHQSEVPSIAGHDVPTLPFFDRGLCAPEPN